MFYPLYEKLLPKFKSKTLTSITLCLLVVILILGPVSYLFGALVSEATTAVTKVNEMKNSGELDKFISINLPWLDSIKLKLQNYFDLTNVETEKIIKDAVQNTSSIILNQTSWIIGNVSRMLLYFTLMIFTMYYFFTDGELLIKKIKRLMPLTDEQVEVTFKHLRDVIQATMYGGLTVALLQGFLGGLMFAVAGIPSAVFWGTVMAFLSIIPFVGAFVIFIPAGLLLIISGAYLKGILIIVIGSVVISQVDNIIRPLLIAGKASMHPLLLFFALMGGVYLFGLLGVILGPIIAAVFVTLITIFEFKLHPEDEIVFSEELNDTNSKE